MTDYRDACDRHWDDAENLHGASRLANADHLYGFAAECGLKILMMRFGMTLNPTTGKPSVGADVVHADKLWARYESYRSGNPVGTGYALPTSNPFANWDVNQRYHNQGVFSAAVVTAHRVGAEEVRKLVKQAELAGLFP